MVRKAVLLISAVLLMRCGESPSDTDDPATVQCTAAGTMGYLAEVGTVYRDTVHLVPGGCGESGFLILTGPPTASMEDSPSARGTGRCWTMT